MAVTGVILTPLEYPPLTLTGVGLRKDFTFDNTKIKMKATLRSYS